MGADQSTLYDKLATDLCTCKGIEVKLDSLGNGYAGALGNAEDHILPIVICISVKGIAAQHHVTVSYNGKDRLLFGFYRIDGKGIQHALNHRLFSHPYAHGESQIALAAYHGESCALLDRKALDHLHGRADIARDVSAGNVHLSAGNDEMIKVAVAVNIQYRVFVYDKVGYCVLTHGSVVECPAVIPVDIVGSIDVIIEMILDDVNCHYVLDRPYVDRRVVKNHVGVVAVLDDKNKVSVARLPGSGGRAFIMIEVYAGIGNIAHDGVKLAVDRYEGMLAAIRANLSSVGPVSILIDPALDMTASLAGARLDAGSGGHIVTERIALGMAAILADFWNGAGSVKEHVIVNKNCTDGYRDVLGKSVLDAVFDKKDILL